MSENEKLDSNPSLYKYVSLNEYDLSNLRKGLLFLRTASFFNDKFDSAPYYSKAIFEEILQDNIDSGGLEGLKKTYASFDDDYRRRILSHIVKDAMDSSFQDVGLVSCFSDNCRSNIMWAHYGDIYKGAIFEYKWSDLMKAAQDHLLDAKKKGLFNFAEHVILKTPILEKVTYDRERSDITFELNRAKSQFDFFGVQEDFSDPYFKYIALQSEEYLNIMRKTYFHKACEWNYESEWRLVIPNYQKDRVIPKDDTGKTILIQVKPKSVILGNCTPGSKVKEVIQICLEEGIKMYGSAPNYFAKTDVIIIEPLRKDFIDLFR